MKVFDSFNNVSEKLRPAKLQRGEVAWFQFLIGQPDYKDPTKTLYPASYRIKTIDRVYDPGKNDFVDIGVFETRTIDPQGNVAIRTRPEYVRGGLGLKSCTGGIVAEEELYEFLEMSNENISNPNRDTSVVPKFKRINAKKEAQDNIKKLDSLTEALVFARGMNEKDVREFAAAMNWDENSDYEVLQNQIGDFAKKTPDEFIKFNLDPELKDKALIKFALTKNIITYDVATNKMLWTKSNSVIANLERMDGKNSVDNFCEWLRTSPGNNVMAGIKKQLNSVIKESNKPNEILAE